MHAEIAKINCLFSCNKQKQAEFLNKQRKTQHKTEFNVAFEVATQFARYGHY